MRAFVLSDNRQTADGMRLCGCAGRLLDADENPLRPLDELLAAGEYGVILITQKLYAAYFAEISARAARYPHVLIAEIPDRHGMAEHAPLVDYLRQTVGLHLEDEEST